MVVVGGGGDDGGGLVAVPPPQAGVDSDRLLIAQDPLHRHLDRGVRLGVRLAEGDRGRVAGFPASSAVVEGNAEDASRGVQSDGFWWGG